MSYLSKQEEEEEVEVEEEGQKQDENMNVARVREVGTSSDDGS